MSTIGECRRLMGPAKKRLTDVLAIILGDLNINDNNELLCLEFKLDAYWGKVATLKDKIRELASGNKQEEERLVEEAENFGETELDVEDARIKLHFLKLKGSSGRLLTDPDEGAIEAPSGRVIESEPVTVRGEPGGAAATVQGRPMGENTLGVDGCLPREFPSTVENPEGNYCLKFNKLTLPTFDGKDIFKWQGFWESFQSAVHLNPRFRPIDKFNCLRAQLLGEAEKCILGLELSNGNYEVAVHMLLKRFGDKRILIERLHRELNGIKPSSNNIVQLRNTLGDIERLLRSLHSLGEDVNHNSLIPLIKSKFPVEILLKIEERTVNCEDNTVQNLRVILENEVLIRERVNYSIRELIPPHKIPDRRSLINDVSTTEALTIKEIKCIYCEKAHWSDECTVFKTLETRQNKLKGRCFNCLRRSHLNKDCPSIKPCHYCRKIKSHHRSLCYKNPHLEKIQNRGLTATEPEDVKLVNINERVVMQTAVVQCQTLDSQRKARFRALFDSGSQRSYVTNQFVKALGLTPFDNGELLIFNFGSKNPRRIRTSFVKFCIKLHNGLEKVLIANVVPTIVGKEFSGTELKDIKMTYKDLVFAEDFNFRDGIKLLIGNDYYFDFLNLRKLEVSKGLYLIDSKVGWILGGREIKEKSTKGSELASFTFSCFSCDLLYEPDIPLVTSEATDLRKLWDLDTLGIKENPTYNDDDKAILEFNKSISFREGRYFVSWPWREFPPALDTNYALAIGRLKSLLKRLKDCPENLVKYNSTLAEQLTAGVVELVDEDNYKNKLVHYIPHHAVFTPSKTTTKLRIVYDASAKINKQSKSLNECLFRGRVLLEDLVGLLLRFRLKPFAVTCDIEKAFLQIGLNEDSRDVTRFLWVKDITKPLSPENIAVLRFARVTFGIVSSPFLLAAVIRYHLRKIGSRLANIIADNIYVDNVSLTFDQETEGAQIYNETKGIFQSASMNIREWSTNSKHLRNSIPEKDRSPNPNVKVLGVNWDTNSDSLRLSFRHDDNFEGNWTKRSILKVISSVFDPLGLGSPITILGKLFIRSLWEIGVDWDETLDKSLIRNWENIFVKIKELSSIQVHRYLGVQDRNSTIELHCFSDASGNAYATSIYLRAVVNNGDVKTSLIFAKARVSPLRTDMSTPKLELLGVLIGVRSLKFVIQHLKIHITSVFLWTDSKCVLNWLSTSKPLPVFVERRLREINQETFIKFLHVPGSENPADIATRGLSFGVLAGCSLWWGGPTWLQSSGGAWSYTEEIQSDADNVAEEFVCVAKSTKTTNVIDSPFGIDEKKYCTLIKLLRVTAYCLKFVKALRGCLVGELNACDLKGAKIRWDRYVQEKTFGHVIKAINEGRDAHLQRQLGLWIDDCKIVRCKGRLVHAALNDMSKFPKLLPKSEYYTKLVVEACHKKLFHSGTSHTLAAIREEYWIPQGRSFVYKVLQNCLVCKKFNGGSYSTPDFPPLPKFRVTKTAPFENTGLDYIGPLFYKRKHGDRCKVWVCIFTCLITRAIHLEMVENMTSEEFLLCFRRFIARRRLPKLVISDNAGQFKVGKLVFDHLWQGILTSNNVVDFSSGNNIEWKFIPELSPWMGGIFERLIGITKNCLRKHIGRACLGFTQLLTVLSEVENIINSRPLVYVTADGLGDEVLTPAHFLCLQFHPCTGTEFPQQRISDAWKKGQNLLNEFWRVWREQYLKCLRERNEIRLKAKIPSSKLVPRIGAVVHIKDKGPRGKWSLGIIEDLNKSQDGEVRSVKLRLASKSLIVRPLKEVYPLEVDAEENLTKNKKKMSQSLDEEVK